MHILEWGLGNVAINHCLIYVCHRPPLTIRSGSGKIFDQDWADRMQEVGAWCQDSETIIELHGICHHGCSWLGRGIVVGALGGSCVWAKPQLPGAVGNCGSLLPKGIVKVGV